MNDEKLRLREEEIYPSQEILEKVLGASYDAYLAFQDDLAGFEIEQEWQWYAHYKTWAGRGQYYYTTSRGTKKEKTLYWLYVFEGYFTVSVWFLEKNRLEALRAGVSDDTEQLIREAKTWGKLATFPVIFEITTTESLADICALIKCKKKLET